MTVTAQSYKNKHTRPNGHRNRPGGLLSTGLVENRANPVLSDDIYTEPIRTNGVIKLAGDYVRFFDETDSLLHVISSVFNASPTTRAIIRQKTTLTIGDGFVALKGRPNSLFAAQRKAAEPVTDPATLSALDDALSVVNADSETLAEVAEKAVQEYFVYGNAYVILSRAAGKVFAHHAPFVKGRVSERKEGEAQYVGFNDEWKQRSWTGANVTKIPLYPAWSESENGVQRTVIHIKDHAPGFEYYGLPEWIAALQYAEMEYRIAKFNSSKFDNSFVPSGVLQFFGATSQEEGAAIVRDVKKKYTGTGKNGGLLVQVLRDETLKAHYTPMEDKSEGAFLELSRVSAQAIVSAHRSTMSLAGFALSGKLGTNEQIRREFEIVQNTVIRPVQNMICRRFLNVFLPEIAKTNPAISGIYIDIQNATPVSFIGDVSLDGVLTVDERREIVGYGPLPEDQQPQKPQTQQQTDNGSDNDTDPDTAA